MNVMESNAQWWPAPAQSSPAPPQSQPQSPLAPLQPDLPRPPDHGHESPPYEEHRQSWLKRTFGPALAVIVAFLAKFKTILLLAPKLKLLTTVGTMAVSLAAYAWIWGVPFAAGFVVLLFVHEMGHVIQLRREGIKASAPMFIPFLGAVITARSLGDNATAEARVGLAGPILGSIGAAGCILIWHATGNDVWRALAYTGFLLNLFNLLPVVPLDGGRAMAAMAPWMWFAGFAALIPLVFVFSNPIIVLLIVFAGMETYRRWQQRKHGGEQSRAYYSVRPIDRALVAAVYLSLIVLLVVGMDATNLPRTFS
jgi:Zn-dependent protease